jgi:hypothetical protein
VVRTHEDTRLTASLTRSTVPAGPDRLRSIRSRLILGMLLPYVCLMGVCAVVLFTGPAGADRFPALLVLVGAAVLLPAAMARIARGILGEAEALGTDRATLAGDSVAPSEAAEIPESVVEVPESIVEVPAEPVEPALSAPDAEVEAEPDAADAVTEPAAAVTEPNDAVTEPNVAVTGSDDVGTDVLVGDIDEDSPLAAAVVVETGPNAQVVDEGGPFAALFAANRRLLARWGAPAESDEPVADAVVAVAVDEDPPVATASDVAPAAEPEAVDEDAPIAAAVATPDPATVESAAATAGDAPEATPEAAPRPMLVPSAIGRQILTGTPAEPAA